MSKKTSHSTISKRGFAIIDDGSWRGIIAPKSVLSPAQLAILIEDLEDTSPQFLAKTHKEYKQAKVNGTLISSSEIEQGLNLP